MIRLQELELVFGHTYGRTYVRTDGWKHRRDVGNSILDWIIEHYLVLSDACRQKNQHPSSNEAKKAVKIIAS